jgi:PAS domain S-box-containing protein
MISTTQEPGTLEQRVLMLSTVEEGAPSAHAALTAAGLEVETCAAMEDMCRAIEEGAAAALLVAQTLRSPWCDELIATLARQPQWSDFPLIIFSGGKGKDVPCWQTLKALGALNNVTLMKVPFHAPMLVAAVQVALRARQRQYEARNHFQDSSRRLNALIHASTRVLAEKTPQGVLRRIADAARELTRGRLSIAGHGYARGKFLVGTSSRAGSVGACPEPEMLEVHKGGVYLDLIHKCNALRLSDQQLRTHSAWWGLPEDHAPLRGLLGARLVDAEGGANGLIMVTDKEVGDFDEHDEALLKELAAIASLALQHIDARTSAEKRAAEAEEGRRVLEALMAHIPEGITIADAPDVTIRRVSRYGCELAGRPREVLEGVPASEQPGTWHIYSLPDERLAAPEDLPLTRAVQQGEVVRNEEWMLRRPDGTCVPILCNAGPIKDADDRILGGVMAWRDITVRKQAEEALRKAHDELGIVVQQRTTDLAKAVEDLQHEIRRRHRAQAAVRDQARILDAIFKYTTNPLVLLDREFNFVRVNEAYAQACGRPMADCAGQNYFGLYPHAENQAIFQHVLRTKVPHRAVAKPLLFPDHPEWGATYWDWTLTPLLDDAGEVEFLVFSLENVTERRHADEQFRELNEALERRAAQLQALASELTTAEQRERRRLAQVLHDHLQQLLYAARLNVGTLRRRAEENDLQRAVQQIDQLLDQAIAESRSLTTELSPPVLYDGGLAAALEWLARQMEEKHGLCVQVSADATAQPATEEMSVLLFEAVRELLFNVVKHAEVQFAEVHMGITAEQQVSITVADQGVGFDPRRLKNEKASTAGFGLFSIRERLELAGGSVHVESTPAEGTQVTILAPQQSPATRGAAAPAAVPETPPVVSVSPRVHRVADGRRRIRVLLADDHALLREGLASLLHEEPDIELVGEAADGRAAVELALRVKPDVILMDVTMPRMDGIEATRRITAALPEVRVIGLSMHEQEDMAAAMYEAGASAYLSKGGPSESLLATIRGVSARSQEG